MVFKGHRTLPQPPPDAARPPLPHLQKLNSADSDSCERLVRGHLVRQTDRQTERQTTNITHAFTPSLGHTNVLITLPLTYKIRAFHFCSREICTLKHTLSIHLELFTHFHSVALSSESGTLVSAPVDGGTLQASSHSGRSTRSDTELEVL